MKNLILSVTLSLMTGFVYSQNCTFGIYLKSYRNTSSKISFTKRKDLTFYIKTDSCICFGNNFRVFVKNDLKNWGKLVNTEINENLKRFYLSVDENLNYEIIVEENKVTVIETNNGNKKVFISKNFNTKWVI